MELNNIKMWESILKELWHYPLNSWLVECIKAALKDQGLLYNPETKEIQQTSNGFKIEAGKWYVCIKHIPSKAVYKDRIYKADADGHIFSDTELHYQVSEDKLTSEYFRPATPEEIPQEPKQENTLKGAIEAIKEIITCAEDFQKQNPSDGELTEFEKEIAHVLVYKCYDGNLETEEKIHNAHRQYYDDAKFFAPMLLAKARKQIASEINIDERVQKFKVGDKIKLAKEPKYPAREIIAIQDDAYYFDKVVHLPFSRQDEWELVEQKPIKDVCDTCDEKASCVNPCPIKLVGQNPTNKVDQHSLPVSDDSSLPTFDESIYHPCTEKACERESSEWSEEDEAVWAEISDLLWEGYKQSGSKFSWDDIRNWIKPKIEFFKDRVFPQSKQEWSDEDEAVLDALIRRLEGEDIYVSPHLAVKCLKSLKERVQSKQEWSEEDKGNLLDVKCIIDEIWHNQYVRETIDHSCEELESLWHWLDNIWQIVEYPQSHWKPSEEQIETLEKVIGYSAFPDAKYCVELKRLLEQLKAL